MGGHSQGGKGAFSCARVRFKEKGVFGIGSSDIPRFLSFFVKGAAIGRGAGALSAARVSLFLGCLKVAEVIRPWCDWVALHAVGKDPPGALAGGFGGFGAWLRRCARLAEEGGARECGARCAAVRGFMRYSACGVCVSIRVCLLLGSCFASVSHTHSHALPFHGGMHIAITRFRRWKRESKGFCTLSLCRRRFPVVPKFAVLRRGFGDCLRAAGRAPARFGGGGAGRVAAPCARPRGRLEWNKREWNKREWKRAGVGWLLLGLALPWLCMACFGLAWFGLGFRLRNPRFALAPLVAALCLRAIPLRQTAARIGRSRAFRIRLDSSFPLKGIEIW